MEYGFQQRDWLSLVAGEEGLVLLPPARAVLRLLGPVHVVPVRGGLACWALVIFRESLWESEG